jgi:predicted nucleic acid-binding Zn ribbon protein
MNKKCEYCGKEYQGRSIFCSNKCYEAHIKRYNKELKALLLKEKVLQKHEELFLKELEMENNGVNMVKLNVDHSYRFACVDNSLER